MLVKLAGTPACVTLTLMLYAFVILNIGTHYPHHVRLILITLDTVVICNGNAVVAYILTGWEYHVI